MFCRGGVTERKFKEALCGSGMFYFLIWVLVTSTKIHQVVYMIYALTCINFQKEITLKRKQSVQYLISTSVPIRRPFSPTAGPATGAAGPGEDGVQVASLSLTSSSACQLLFLTQGTEERTGEKFSPDWYYSWGLTDFYSFFSDGAFLWSLWRVLLCPFDCNSLPMGSTSPPASFSESSLLLYPAADPAAFVLGFPRLGRLTSWVGTLQEGPRVNILPRSGTCPKPSCAHSCAL